MSKESFILHTDSWDILKDFSDEQCGRLLKALLCYQIGAEIPALDVATKVAFSFMSAQMDRDNEKYSQMVEKRRAAGKKSAEARQQTQASANTCQQVLTSVNHTDTDTDTVTDTDTDTERETDTDTEAPRAPRALPDLSLRDEDALRSVAGDRADGLIEDVRAYYTSHPEKSFPGWPIALAQFDRNQRRWNKAGPKKAKSLEELAAEAFAGMEGTT